MLEMLYHRSSSQFRNPDRPKIPRTHVLASGLSGFIPIHRMIQSSTVYKVKSSVEKVIVRGISIVRSPLGRRSDGVGGGCGCGEGVIEGVRIVVQRRNWLSIGTIVVVRCNGTSRRGRGSRVVVVRVAVFAIDIRVVVVWAVGRGDRGFVVGFHFWELLGRGES